MQGLKNICHIWRSKIPHNIITYIFKQLQKTQQILIHEKQNMHCHLASTVDLDVISTGSTLFAMTKTIFRERNSILVGNHNL